MATLNITVSVTSNIVSHLTIPEPLDRATGKNARKMSEKFPWWGGTKMSENDLVQVKMSENYFKILGNFLTYLTGKPEFDYFDYLDYL